MAITNITIQAEIHLLVMSDTPISKIEENTLVLEMEQILNKTTPIEMGNTKIGTRFHFKEIK